MGFSPSKDIGGVEHVQTVQGNYVPKHKVINDVSHIYDTDKQDYVPEAGNESMRNSVINAGADLWKKVTGSGT